MINRRRIVRSPRFETAPSFCLPPVDFCSGVSPSQAAKSRPMSPSGTRLDGKEIMRSNNGRRLARNRKFVDSPLEGAVCCELVSEMELAKPVFWDVDGKMDPFPQAVGHLNDWYYAYFSNARLAPAAHFPVYQRDLFKTSGFLVNYGSKAHDIGGLDRN